MSMIPYESNLILIFQRVVFLDNREYQSLDSNLGK